MKLSAVIASEISQLRILVQAHPKTRGCSDSRLLQTENVVDSWTAFFPLFSVLHLKGPLEESRPSRPRAAGPMQRSPGYIANLPFSKLNRPLIASASRDRNYRLSAIALPNIDSRRARRGRGRRPRGGQPARPRLLLCFA
ncbi:hypothetical protein EVAR_20756_1 [Eumeta japonica]|uniref:Uncharacterized protein n=1 Tax=Eumeta variegata TaxID=151549 RepID=A0A4C1V9H3_EUMVA|nr:hypothetical protein EVAR_20756_1 [Eumeta japonica]